MDLINNLDAYLNAHLDESIAELCKLVSQTSVSAYKNGFCTSLFKLDESFGALKTGTIYNKFSFRRVLHIKIEPGVIDRITNEFDSENFGGSIDD